MKKALLIVILISIIGLSATMIIASPAPVEAASISINVDQTTAAHIYQSTVQIAMYEYDPITGQENGGRGLGTIVRHNGQTVIITHDHWSHINERLNVVEFSDAAGRLVVTLNAAEFQNLIQYRDSGTMVLSLPPALAGFVPAVLAAPNAVQTGDTVLVARRIPTGSRDTVEIIGASVESVVSGSGPSYLKMTGSDNAAVIPGDSGGGVWVNGQLAANLWSGSLVVEQTWFDRLIGSKQVSQTNLINAALNPLQTAA